jgi:D-galactarolactone cycloisomerase
MNAIKIERVQAWVLRLPIAKPVKTSFGIMHERPAVMLQLTDSDGATGLGEIWCNFPDVGAEHRARLAVLTMGDLIQSKSWESPEQFFEYLSSATRVLALQSGELGPFAQVIAGLDMAMWDLLAQHKRHPLWRLLGGQAHIQTYASGLAAADQPTLALEKLREGHTAFKLKVGFGLEKDTQAMKLLRQALSPSCTLMIDANQAWSVESAVQHMNLLSAYEPAWIEEPLRCDAPWSDWQALSRQISTPIALGENLRDEDFLGAIDSGVVKVLQPDIGKWGGFTGCMKVGAQAIEAGMLLCPHWLGGGIGLKASMHLLAALNSNPKNLAARVEWDSNPNQLRERMSGGLPQVINGGIELDQQPGLGVKPVWDELPITHHIDSFAP